jgi:hypothetical protein
VSERRRSLQGDLSRLEETFEAAATEAERMVRDAVSAQPFLAVGAAAGLGFLLGGGLPRGTAALLLGAGTRLAGAWLERELHERAHAQEDT